MAQIFNVATDPDILFRFFPSYHLSLRSEISATESLLPITFRPKWERGEFEAAQGPLPPTDLPLERASLLATTAFENNCQRSAALGAMT